MGSEFQIDILTEDQMELQEEIKEETKKSEDYEFTFETFIVGPSNKFAHAAAMAVATKPAQYFIIHFSFTEIRTWKNPLIIRNL